jgi:hypothetical protein
LSEALDGSVHNRSSLGIAAGQKYVQFLLVNV